MKDDTRQLELDMGGNGEGKNCLKSEEIKGDTGVKWRLVPLVELCKPKQWPTISKTQMLSSGYPVFGANGRIGYYSDYNHEKPTILITCRGATCGSINVCDPKSYVIGNAMALDNLDENRVDLKFIIRALKSTDFSGIITGVAQPQITRQSLSRLQIPLPPLEEQKRIARILDAADELRAKRRQALAELDILLQSTFLDMFGDPVTNPKGWKKFALNEVTLKITDGEHLNPNFSEIGMPMVMAGNVLETGIDIENAKRVEELVGEKFRKKCAPEEKDILIVSRGATIGRMCIVNIKNPFCLMGSVILIKPSNKDIEPEFFCWFLRYPAIRMALYKTSGSSAQQAIYIKDIRKLLIIVPPLELQQKFATIVEAVEQQKARMKEHLVELDALFASLQHRAFNGEL